MDLHSYYLYNMDTHSYYLILIAFPWQQWLCKCISLLCYMYIACHVSLLQITTDTIANVLYPQTTANSMQLTDIQQQHKNTLKDSRTDTGILCGSDIKGWQLFIYACTPHMCVLNLNVFQMMIIIQEYFIQYIILSTHTQCTALINDTQTFLQH